MKLKKVIQPPFHDIIQHDEEELMELVGELKDEADNDDYIDVFITDGILKGNPILLIIGGLIKHSKVIQSQSRNSID